MATEITEREENTPQITFRQPTAYSTPFPTAHNATQVPDAPQDQQGDMMEDSPPSLSLQRPGPSHSINNRSASLDRGLYSREPQTRVKKSMRHRSRRSPSHTATSGDSGSGSDDQKESENLQKCSPALCGLMGY